MNDNLPLRLLIIPLLLTLFLMPLTARAEGPTEGGIRVYLNERAIGPFTLNTFAAPNPPNTSDNLWVTIEIRDNGRAVRDARVFVTVSDRNRPYSQSAEATHELAPTEFDYTAAIPVPEDGVYDVLIEMQHPEGDGSAEFSVNVSRPLTSMIFLMLLAPALLVVAFLVHRFVVKLPASAAILAGDDTPLETNHPDEVGER